MGDKPWQGKFCEDKSHEKYHSISFDKNVYGDEYQKIIW